VQIEKMEKQSADGTLDRKLLHKLEEVRTQQGLAPA
jgi:hypothetical protein